MSLRTHRILGVAAWAAFFLFVAASTPSADRSHLILSMLAWSVVGLAFGVSWFAIRNLIEDRMSFEGSHPLRRFRFAQFGLWMGVILAYVWATETIGAADEATVMGILTLFIAPIWFGVTHMLAPRAAQASLK